MIRKLSLRGKILLSLVGILLLSTLLMLFVIRNISKNKIENENRINIMERHQQFDAAFLNIINRITYTNLYLFDNAQDLYQTLNSDVSRDEKHTYIETLVEEASLDYDTFGKVAVYHEENLYDVPLNNAFIDYPSALKLEDVLQKPEGLYYIETVKDLDGNRYLTFSQHISTMYPDRDIFGLALFYLHESLIEDSISLLTSEQSLSNAFSLIYTEEDNYSNKEVYVLENETMINTNEFPNVTDQPFLITEIKGDKLIIIHSELSNISQTYPSLNFHIVSVIKYDILYADFLQLNQYILIVGLISLVFLVFLATRITEKITKPIKRLINDLRQFKRDKQKKGLSNLNEKDEIYELEQTYNEMIEEIIRLINENNLEMENKRKLELYALQMQINPHFLYNTLDTIAWLAKLKGEKDIEHLVISLAKFFRLSLHKGDKFIKIREEIELVNNFLEIEKMRFPELFDVIYEVDNSIKEIETLKLIFQPIVENAIKHGFSDIDYKGKIIIRAYPNKDDIIFEVEDNGIGFNPDEDVFSDNKLLSGLGGYGLKNVDERIKLEYGKSYGVEIDSTLEKGTKIMIKIKKTHHDSLSNE